MGSSSAKEKMHKFCSRRVKLSDMKIHLSAIYSQHTSHTQNDARTPSGSIRWKRLKCKVKSLSFISGKCSLQRDNFRVFSNLDNENVEMFDSLVLKNGLNFMDLGERFQKNPLSIKIGILTAERTPSRSALRVRNSFKQARYEYVP